MENRMLSGLNEVEERDESGETNESRDMLYRERDSEENLNFNDYIQVVSFLVGREEYGIEILYIHEINRITQITRVPNTPSFIRGIMNLRGNVIPVVDLREKFGLPAKDFDEETRVIVIEMDQKLVAVIVDQVHQTLRIKVDDVEYTNNMIAGISGDYIKGVAKYKNRLIIILRLGDALLEETKEDGDDGKKDKENI